MARIPESEIVLLKNEVSVQRLVEASSIALKKTGRDYTGCCPFHEDATASLVVTPAKNLWHCFGCGVGGGPIDWVMKKNGVSFRHAVELLRDGISSLRPGSGQALAAGSAAGAVAIKRTTVRALDAPVAFDAKATHLRSLGSEWLLFSRYCVSAADYLHRLFRRHNAYLLKLFEHQ